MYSTPKQNGAIGAMVAKMGLTKDAKMALIESFSDGRTDTTKQLYFEEATALIKHLKRKLNVPDSPKDKMTNKILSLAHEMGWELKDGKIDMGRVNNWCIKYGQFRKRLDLHDVKHELPALVTQFEQVHKSFLMG